MGECRNVRQTALALALLVPFVAAGCARHAPEPTARPAVATKADTPLPDWAPENPSPEFLRAARLMQPFRETPGPEPGLGAKAMSVHFNRTQIAAWEVLGSLTDGQLAHLVSTKEVLLPVKSLTEKQRALLERYFAVWRREMKDLPERETEWGKDWLVDLYKGGAREDLSNVLLTFQVRSRGRVAMILYVVKPDGSLSVPFPAGIADLDERRDRTPSANDGRSAEDRREGESP
jgi:hypothetical protein